MRPLIKDGETIRAVSYPPASLRLGDCAVYQWEGKTLIHRIWWKSDKSFFMKDDVGLMRIHRVFPERMLFKVISKGFWSKGLPGLAYSILFNTLFFSSRQVRKLFILTPKQNAAPPLTSTKTPL